MHRLEVVSSGKAGEPILSHMRPGGGPPDPVALATLAGVGLASPSNLRPVGDPGVGGGVGPIVAGLTPIRPGQFY